MVDNYSRQIFHYETDSDGVCHFSNYFRIAEEALFHALGLEMGRFAVLEATAQYLQPLRHGSPFAVSIELAGMRPSNFTLIFVIGNSPPAARLTIRFAPIDPVKWEIVPISKILKEKLKQYDHSCTYV